MVHIQKKDSQTYEELVLSVLNNLNVGRNLRDAKKILIKPNLVTTKTASEGVTTDMNLLRSIIEVLGGFTKAEITVGENSLINTDEVFRFLDVYELEKSGCIVENFEENEWVKVRAPFGLLFESFLIPKTAYECDLIINVSKMKTHQLTGVTLGIKNFLGLLSEGGRKYAHLYDINKGIVDVYSYFERDKKIISIVDGLVALSGKSGPTTGTPVRLDYSIASTNTVHCDAAAVRMMGAAPLQIEHIRLASEVLGVDIKQTKPKGNSRGANLTPPEINFNVPLVPARSRFRLDAWLFKNVFYKYPFQKDSQLCISCKRCKNICPKAIVTVERNAFEYNASECIHCLCCVEACNTGAISYKIKNRLLYILLRYCWRLPRLMKNCTSMIRSGGKN